MIKSMNMFNNMTKFAAPGAPMTGPKPYQARTPRLALGFVGGTLAAVTIAVAVILPASVHSGGREPALQLASQTISAASIGAVTSITVVATREPRPSTGPLRTVAAAPRPAMSGETASSPILLISTAAR